MYCTIGMHKVHLQWKVQCVIELSGTFYIGDYEGIAINPETFSIRATLFPLVFVWLYPTNLSLGSHKYLFFVTYPDI